MSLRRAQTSEAETLYGWILEWSSWFERKAIEQWNPPYPKDRFLRELDAGQVFCFGQQGRTLGAVTIFENAPNYYPSSIWNHEPSLYLFRFVIPRSLSGTGVGEAILAAVEEEALGKNVPRLRLDAVISNPFLSKYWSRGGFRAVQKGEIRGTPVVFMEKMLASHNVKRAG